MAHVQNVVLVQNAVEIVVEIAAAVVETVVETVAVAVSAVVVVATPRLVAKAKVPANPWRSERSIGPRS